MNGETNFGAVCRILFQRNRLLLSTDASKGKSLLKRFWTGGGGLPPDISCWKNFNLVPRASLRLFVKAFFPGGLGKALFFYPAL